MVQLDPDIAGQGKVAKEAQAGENGEVEPMTPPFTPASISEQIKSAASEFRQLNGLRYCNAPYRLRGRVKERQIGELADRLARLYRLQAWLRIRSTSTQ